MLACSPCAPVADSGTGLGLDHPNISLTTTVLPEFCNHFDVPFCTGEQHHNLARKHGGAVMRAIDSAFAPRRKRTPLIKGAPCGIEEFTDLGHAGLRHRCCTHFERDDVAGWIGPCPRLQQPPTKPLILDDILDDPSDVPASCFFDDGLVELLPVVFPLSRRRPTVAATITLGGADVPLFTGSRVTFHTTQRCRRCRFQRDSKTYVLFRWHTSSTVVLFYDDRADPQWIENVHVTCLIHHSFTVNVLHTGGVGGTMTSFGVPPIGPAKMLILIDDRVRRLTTGEMYRLCGDDDAPQLYRQALPKISHAALQSKPGKSLQMRLAVMIVVRLRRRIRAFLDARAAGVPHTERPEVVLEQFLRPLALTHAVLVFVALNDHVPHFLISNDFTEVIAVPTAETHSHRTVLSNAPSLARAFSGAMGYVPECFLAGQLDVAAANRFVIVCPLGECELACVDAARLRWALLDEVARQCAELYAIVALALGTTLSMLDHPQCHGCAPLACIIHPRSNTSGLCYAPTMSGQWRPFQTAGAPALQTVREGARVS